MTVAQLKEKYTALQKEAADIEKELKPLFQRLRSFSKRAQALGKRAEEDNNLYVIPPDGRWYADGWNVGLCFRLRDFDYFEEAGKGIDAILYNLRHTPFRRERSTR